MVGAHGGVARSTTSLYFHTTSMVRVDFSRLNFHYLWSHVYA